MFHFAFHVRVPFLFQFYDTRLHEQISALLKRIGVRQRQISRGRSQDAEPKYERHKYGLKFPCNAQNIALPYLKGLVDGKDEYMVVAHGMLT
jgi:hypothetical protein